jgi:hypothetical protein
MKSKLTDIVNDASRQESREVSRGLDECANRDGGDGREVSLGGSRNECAEISHCHCHRLLEGLGLHDSSLKSAQISKEPKETRTYVVNDLGVHNRAEIGRRLDDGRQIRLSHKVGRS